MTGARRHETDPTLMLDVPTFLRAQVREVHLQLDTYLTAWVAELGPGSTTRGSPVPALFLHGATVEDVAIHTLLLKEDTLFSTAWAGTGMARYAPVDLEPIRAYAQEVYAATDAYLAGLTLDAASRRVDLSRLGLGQPSVAWVVSHFVVLELAHLSGELMSAAHIPGATDHPCTDLYRT
jgi:hypothetical protein